MASRKQQKQAARDERARASAQGRADRLERRVYIAIAVVLLVLAGVAVNALSSGHGQPPAGPPILEQPNGVPSGGAAVSSLRGGVPVPHDTAARELAANEQQANRVSDGSIVAKVAQLRGLPIVINQWASWCPNCRSEFGFFQTASRELAHRVAFLGLDSQDSRGGAEAFLRRHPVNYPSVFDPSAAQAFSLGGGQGWPTTFILDAKHQLVELHEGAYQSLGGLLQDIESHLRRG